MPPRPTSSVMRLRLCALPILAACALVAAGCGGGASSSAIQAEPISFEDACAVGFDERRRDERAVLVRHGDDVSRRRRAALVLGRGSLRCGIEASVVRRGHVRLRKAARRLRLRARRRERDRSPGLRRSGRLEDRGGAGRRRCLPPVPGDRRPAAERQDLDQGERGRREGRRLRLPRARVVLEQRSPRAARCAAFAER